MTTALVTGATPGSLGHATARALVERGFDVVVTARSAIDPRASGALAAHRLDLTDVSSVEGFAHWYGEQVGRLDLLVNNAGVHLDLRSKWTRPRLLDGAEPHWRTNYLGTAHLTHRLLPLLLQSSAPRLVNVVSKLHARGTNAAVLQGVEPYDSWVAYGTSKLALVHLTTELARREPALVTAALHPGSVYTRIADRDLEEQRLLSRVRRLAAPLERRALLSPEVGARTTVHCATAPDVVSGGYYERSALKEPSADAQDATVAAELWDRTEAWLATLA